MPTQQSQREIQCITGILTLLNMLGVINNCANGATLGEIDRALKTSGMSLARRTLQRRLASLVRAGTLELEGAKRGSRYKVRRDFFASIAPTPPSSKATGK